MTNAYSVTSPGPARQATAARQPTLPTRTASLQSLSWCHGTPARIRVGTEREPATRNLAGYGIALARPSGRPRKSAASQRQPSVRVAQYPKARYRGEDSEQLASERCSYQCRNLCRRSCVPMWRVMACPPYIGDASEQSASACCASLTSPGASFKVSARWSVCLHSSHCLSWWYASPK
jgi:hypothetical protein